MPKLQFLDTNNRPLLSGFILYVWDAASLPAASQFPSKIAPKTIVCGKLDGKGNLQAFRGLELPGLSVSIPGCRDGPVKVGKEGLQAGLLRTFFQLPQEELQSTTIDDVEQIKLSAVNPQLLSRMPPIPVVNLRFFVLSNLVVPEGVRSVQDLINSWVGSVRYFWSPGEKGVAAKYAVTFQWDETYKLIGDSTNAFKRIDFFSSGSPQALSLVRENWTNPHFNPDIPIFVCSAAWDEDNEPGQPHDGLLSGHTLTKGGDPSWFRGERAILLFTHSASPDTLAHEMTHWVGFNHRQSEALGSDNIGRTGGGGGVVDPKQFAKLYRWATIRGFRQSVL